MFECKLQIDISELQFYTDQFFIFHLFVFFRIGLGTSRSKLNYKQFLHAFEEGRKSSYGPRKQDVRIEEQPDLNPQEAEHRLRELVGSQVEILERVGGHYVE